MEEGKQKALFLTSIGQQMYAKLKTWIRPNTLSELTLAQIVARLKERTTEETVEIAERYKFFKRQQQPGETVVEYMSGLKQLASTCNFADYLATALKVSCSSFTSSLANFLRTYRNVPHTSTGHSPAELIFGRMPRTHLSMLLPSTAERVKAGLQPSENLLPPRRLKKGEDVWVRDYRPNAICKWIKAVIESVDGPLNYNVVLDNGHSRRVHVDHIIDRPELPTPNPTTTAASRPPEELRDMIVQDVPRDGNHFPSSPVTPSTTCSADTASSGTVLTPATVIQPQVRRSSRSVKAPKRLIEEM